MENKDDIFTKHGALMVQEYGKKENRILRDINKRAINVSPKIWDRSCRTQMTRNTGQGTSFLRVCYGNGNIPNGTWLSQINHFPNLDDEIKTFCTPAVPMRSSKHEGNRFTIFSEDLRKNARIQRSRAPKSGREIKKKKPQSNLRKIFESLQSSSGSAIFTPKRIDKEPPTEQNSQKKPRLKLSDETSEFCKQLSYGTKKGSKKLKKEKKKARP